MAARTESSICISAPPAAVMGVIADIDAYPSWNQEVKEIEVVEKADGRPSQVRFVLDAGVIKDDYTLAYVWEDDDAVSWRLVRAGMLTAMDGSYELTDNGDGTTQVTYRLVVDVKIPMIGMMKRKAEKVIIERALSGLKKRVEA